MSASNNPGLDTFAVPATSAPPTQDTLGKDGKEFQPELERYKDLGGLDTVLERKDSSEEGTIIAPDQFDDKYRTTKWEIWSYYACVETTRSCITGASD
jgi:hypothetical protein